MGRKGTSAIRWEPDIWKAILLSGAFLVFGLVFVRRTLSHSEERNFQKNHGGASIRDGTLPDGRFLTSKVLGRSESSEVTVSKGPAVTGSGGTCKLGFELGSIACCGHRGARIMAPENTLPAFRAAVEFGANCLEMDVHITADGGLVVMHERTMREKYYVGAKLPIAKKGVERAPAGWGFGERWGAQKQRRHFAAHSSERDLASLAGGLREDVNSSDPSRTTTTNLATDHGPQREGRKIAEADIQPRVEDMSLREIKELDAGGWFGRQFAGTPVPSLGEVLESLWEEELQLVVELKAEARCDTIVEGQSNEDYWDIGASSKAIQKATSKSRCSSRQFEKRFVRSLMNLLNSMESPDHAGGKTQGRLRVLFASFNHRLIDQLTMELGRRQVGDTLSLVQGTAYILHPQEAYDGHNFLKEVKWLAPHWSKTEMVKGTNAPMHMGRQVVAWVADDLPELRHQVDLGVSGVITNDPSLCRQLCS